jgi:glucan 1,3-beta-glucosidase
MGLYSFFNNWSTTCSNNGGADNCQNNIFSIESGSSLINVYGYSTVGVVNMITKNGGTVAVASQNKDGFVQTISVFRSG